MAIIYNKNGTSGADTIYVTEPGINVFGGYGNDTFIVKGNAVNNSIGDEYSGQNKEYGDDTLKILAGDEVSFRNKKGSNTIEISAGMGHYIETGDKVDRLTIKSSASKVQAKLGAGENVITINTGAQHEILAGVGSDTLVVGYMEKSAINVGSGENKITVNGGFGNTITSGDDKDTITINKGYNNTFYANGGDDVFYINKDAGSGNKLYLGKGSDRVTVYSPEKQEIYFNDGSAGDKNIILLKAGSGHYLQMDIPENVNVINEIYVENSNNVTLGWNRNNTKDKVVIKSGTGHSFDLGRNDDMGSIRGGSGNTIKGSYGNDTLSIEGSAGANNTLTGGDGDDNLYVKAGISGVQTLSGGGDDTRDSFNVLSEKAIVHISDEGTKGSFVLNKGSAVDKDGTGHTVTSTARNNYLYIGNKQMVANHVNANFTERLNHCLIYGSDNSVTSSGRADNVYIRSGERNYVNTNGDSDYIYIDGGNNHVIRGGGGDRDNFYVNISLDSNTRLTFDQSNNYSNTDILHLESEYKRNFSYSYDSSTDSLVVKKNNGALITVSNWRGNGLALIKFKGGEEIKFKDSYSVISSNSQLSANSMLAADLVTFNTGKGLGSEPESGSVLAEKSNETMFITGNISE